ncbi:DUF6126 family protein [Streptomyces sp. NPDC091272]|uniref:DUF6126 family protein n=1 Tax=Streptomyces sp. NPDC091272 TaxID=3365981 RepID=UPI00382D925B
MPELSESQTAAMAAIARAAQEAARDERHDAGRKADWNDGAGRPGVLGFVEDRAPRGLVLRVFLYVAVGHVFAAFVYLLFTLGGKG